ncbi:MAG: hypothetical protein CM15mP89_3620 [Gammaproteobacteria bacterium]|nr:MAG: hypothetical protein CM15mP89_3620 [Gammaproteobacteria bacterium]
MTLKVQVVPVTPYQQNCSIIQCEATGLAAIVDPGVISSASKRRLPKWAPPSKRCC